ncbi:MAG: zinc ABC transporter substrate-binding protein [Proteobacteria bacterium]|nr:zinc ABC transporter substrate-binding protein [Pseudomonadota bacterium]MBU1389557.1 zinc ABC transporter substrate-binding protein [Pseudomonadota bacterium]MBU1544421.1 zinc ABC transporter substrate-binding protein [Pseudomonadota bacterium]MBU2480695.1 zinc ABC transporter substrate-binding protein [Pseudomonadota bacterium]
MKQYISIPHILLLLLISVNTTYAADKPQVFVSIIPQKFFVQQIGKDLIDVKVMVQPGASPATYEPKPMQMVDLSVSKLYFSIGVPFEKRWLKKIAASNPDMKIIHTDKGISKIRMSSHSHDHETHEESGDHRSEDEGLDPHIWLSPKLVQIQAKIILNALKQIDPENQSIYQKNFDQFSVELKQTDAQLTRLFTHKTKTQFLVFHPSWGYFATDYGLEQIPVEIEGKDPKPSQLKEIVDLAKKNNIRVIFVQPQNSTRSARIIAKEIKGNIVFADPLAFDWFANMNTIAQKMLEALK